jgi:hypothetical protein
MAKFRRSIQPIGFRPEEVSERNVSELQNYSDRIIQSIREERDAVISNRNDTSNALKENARIESSQAADNAAIQQRNIATQLQAQQDLSKAALDDFDRRTKASKEMFGTIANLSTKAAEKFRKIEIERLEEKDKAQAAEILAMGDNHPAVKALKALSKDMNVEELTSYTEIAKAKENGLGNYEADTYIKQLNELGYHAKTALLRHTSKGWGTYIIEKETSEEKKYTDPTTGKKFSGLDAAGDPRLRQIVHSQELVEFEKITGIAGQLSALKQETGFYDEIFRVTQSAVNVAARAHHENARQSFIEDFQFQFRNAKDSASRTALLEIKAPALRSYLGNEDFHNLLQEMGSKMDSEGNPFYDLAAIEAARLGPNGETWGKRWENRAEAAKIKLAQGKNALHNQDQATKQREADEEFEAIKRGIQAQLAAGDPTQDLSVFATAKARFMDKYGFQPRELVELERYNLEQNRAESQQQANLVLQKINTGLATQGDILSVYDPKLRAELQNQFVARNKVATYGPDFEESLKAAEAGAKQIMKDSLEGTGSAAAILLGQTMKNNLAADYKEGLRKFNNDPARAQSYANEKLQRDIDAALLNKDPNARYYSVTGAGNQRVFKNVKAAQTLTNRQKAEAEETVRSLIAQQGVGALNSPGLLGTSAELRQISNSSRLGQPLIFTPQINQAARLLKISPLEAVNKAIEAHNKFNQNKIEPLYLDPTLQRVNNANPATMALFTKYENEKTARRMAAETYPGALSDPGNMRGSFNGGRTDLPATVSSGEGGWNSVNRGRAGDTRGGAKAVFGKDLTTMTFGEVERQQNAGKVFAVGAYQFTPGVLARARREAGLPENAPMTPENQTKAFWGLAVGDRSKPSSSAKRPKLAAYLRGESSDIAGAHLELSMEWAGVAGPSGRGYYDNDAAGNRASVSAERVQQALIQARKQISGR